MTAIGTISRIAASPSGVTRIPRSTRFSIPRLTRAFVALAQAVRSCGATSGATCAAYDASARASVAENGATIESASGMRR